jgi:hypothetical protein
MRKMPSWVYLVVVLVLIFSPFGRAQSGTPSPGNDKGLCNVLEFDSAAFKAVGVALAYSALTGPGLPLTFALFAVGAVALDYWAKTQHC